MTSTERGDLDRTLRSADPAASLSPLSPESFDRLMKDTTMTTTTSRPARRLVPVLVGGLAAAGIAAFAVVASQPVPAPLELSASPEIMAKCAEVTVDSMTDVDLAFEATVTSIEGDTVTLNVTNRFTGDVGSTVVTTQGDGAVSDGGPLVYEAGETYLVASVDGQVLSCGQSGVETPELRSVYDAAF